MPRTVAYSGSANSDGIFASGVGQDSRTGLRSTESATSSIPGRREAPPAKYNSAGAKVQHARVAQVIAQKLEQFPGARLQDFRHHTLGNQPRGPVPDRRNFYLVSFGDQRNNRVSVRFLDSFCLGDRSAKANGKVAGEMVAAHGNCGRMCDCSLRGTRSTQWSRRPGRQGRHPVRARRAQHGIRAGQRFKDGIVHMDAGAVHSANDILRGVAAAVTICTRTSRRVAIMPSGSCTPV